MGNSSVGATGNKGWQTNTNSSQNGFDAGTTGMRDAAYNATTAAANGGIPQGVQDAMNQYRAHMAAGQTGAAALGGDAAAVAQLSNPYTQQVIDANNNDWQRTNQQTNMAVNSAASNAVAFGGSRYGVALGNAMAGNNAAQQTQSAGLRTAGYSDAMSRAGQMANLGMGAAGAGAQLGSMAGNQDLWRANVLKQGLMGMPHGTNTSGTSGSTKSDVGFTAKAKFGLGG